MLWLIKQGLGSWLESLRSGTSALAMQKTGLLIVEEVKRKRENNKRKIQELVDFLRQEIDASKAKVSNHMHIDATCNNCFYSETYSGK